MNDGLLMKLVLGKLAEGDNAIGREIADRLGVDGDSVAPSLEVLVAVATGHLIAARGLLQQALGREGAAGVLYQHADDLAAGS